MNTKFPTYNCLYLKNKNLLERISVILVHNTFLRNQKGGEAGERITLIERLPCKVKEYKHPSYFPKPPAK